MPGLRRRCSTCRDQGSWIMNGLDEETLFMTLDAIRDFTGSRLPDQVLLELDHRDECPIDVVRAMCGEELGIQLLFIPEEYGGMGGNSFEIYRVCEEMARVDLGVATAVLATFLGSDPITVGATPEQRKSWLTRIAEEGLLFAYGATEEHTSELQSRPHLVCRLLLEKK